MLSHTSSKIVRVAPSLMGSPLGIISTRARSAAALQRKRFFTSKSDNNNSSSSSSNSTQQPQKQQQQQQQPELEQNLKWTERKEAPKWLTRMAPTKGGTALPNRLEMTVITIVGIVGYISWFG